MTSSTGNEARYWYEWVKGIPRTHTRRIITEQTGYVVDGPLRELMEFLVVFKDGYEYLLKSKLTPGEVEVATALNGGSYVVPCEFVSVSSSDDSLLHTFKGLLMPRYSRALSSIHMKFSHPYILERCKNMIDAVNHIHNMNYVHMDIKDSNIFVNDGLWYLGDFGSCVSCGEFVISTTYGLYPLLDSDIINKPANWHHDWFMLTVVMVSYLPDVEGKVEFDPNNPSRYKDDIVSSINKCADHDLQKLLLSLVECHDKTFV